MGCGGWLAAVTANGGVGANLGVYIGGIVIGGRMQGCQAAGVQRFKSNENLIPIRTEFDSNQERRADSKPPFQV